MTCPLLMSQVPSDRYCTPSNCASACPCISSAAHHGTVCHVQADCRKPASAACSGCSRSHGWRVRSSEVALISEWLQCQICCKSAGLQYLVFDLATWHGQFAVGNACGTAPTLRRNGDSGLKTHTRRVGK